MKRQYIIELSTRSNPELTVRSRTTQIKRRLARLKLNIKASRNEAAESLYYPRFDVFNPYDYSELTYRIYVDFTADEDLF